MSPTGEPVPPIITTGVKYTPESVGFPVGSAVTPASAAALKIVTPVNPEEAYRPPAPVAPVISE